MSGRPISEICRELAEYAERNGQDILATILKMAALEAAESGIKAPDGRTQDLLIGAWDWDIKNDRLYADARFAKMFGISTEDAERGTPQKLWMNAIHRDDMHDVQLAIRNALKGDLFAIEYRVVNNGEIHWLYARGKCIFEEGKADRFTGAIVEISHEKLDIPSIAPR